MLRWGGGSKTAYRIWSGKPLTKWQLVIRRRGLEDDTKIDLRGIPREDGRWIEMAQGRVQCQAVVFAMLNLRFLLPHVVQLVISE